MLIFRVIETVISFITVDGRDGSGGKTADCASGAMHAMFLFLIIWILCARKASQYRRTASTQRRHFGAPSKLLSSMYGILHR